MVQAARSGVQNIAEGSMASATSKKTELKLTNVARASLEELRLDYEDFLRQRALALWERNDSRRAELIARRPTTADAVAAWARDVRGWDGQHRQHGLIGPDPDTDPRSAASSTMSTESTKSTYAEISANGALTLIAVASALLTRQIASLEGAFLREGGFTEKLYRTRAAARKALGRNTKGKF
jgi:four helix bundle suffix protein